MIKLVGLLRLSPAQVPSWRWLCPPQPGRRVSGNWPVVCSKDNVGAAVGLAHSGSIHVFLTARVP